MKILFAHKQILFPRDTGGKIRVLNLLKHLARWHDITYVSNLRPGEEQYLPAMRELGEPLSLVEALLRHAYVHSPPDRATREAKGAVWAWQRAMARASAASSGWGAWSRLRISRTISCICFFWALP